LNILSVENISRSHGLRTLFSNISFGLADGDRVALVARNGAGKSSLLRILSGKDTPDTGRVSVRRDVQIGMLEQEPVFDPNKTVIESVLEGGSELAELVQQYELTIESLEVDHSDANQDRLHALSSRMDLLNGWDFESRVKTMLGRMGFETFHQKTSTLSGGQLKRLALVKLLIAEPQLLILDEPTNHLDVDMIEWLENYLASREVTMLLVTHDRYFLDRVCDRIIEIEEGKLYDYAGDFTYFIEKKAEREESQASELEKAKNLYRRELEWVRKMPRARGTKQKARTDAFKDVAEKAKGKRSEGELKLEVKMTRLGGKILELIRVRKQFGEKLILDGFDYVFKRGEKIGIVGKNGVGKSTLLNIILGLEKFDSGKIQTGETIVFGYYSQLGIQLSEDKRIIEVVKDIAEYFPLADGSKLSAGQMLQRFLFSPHTQFNYVSTLSGGERRRLYLLTVLMKNPNFLILDEPTNDLDILTLSVLEDFLLDFPGCVVIVSHDRYFMDKLVDHLFVFEGEGMISDFPGNYSQWREKQLETEKQVKKGVSVAKVVEAEVKIETASVAVEEKRKPTFKEKFEYDQLEKEMPQLEIEKATITEKMLVLTEHAELQKLSVRFAEIEALLEEKGMRWLELSDLM
jgi:ABC transport system ATP-binding/permease protein